MDFLLETPRVHGLAPNISYNIPPLDGSLTIPEIYDWHLLNNPDYTIFTYIDKDGSKVSLSYSKVIPALHRAARFVAKAIDTDVDNVPADLPPVAIMASTDTITSFCVVVGCMRAGIPIFPISPRNSAPAVAHLVEKTSTNYIFISVEASLRELAESAQDILRKNGSSQECKICYMPVFEDVFRDEDGFEPLPKRSYDYDGAVAYVHSSGSTSFPKPIKWTHKSYLQVAVMPHFGVQDLCGAVFGCHALTMNHPLGLNFVGWVAGTGIIMAAFRPSSPAQIPTPEAVFQAFVASKVDILVCVPSFAEIWTRDSSKFNFMRDAKALVYGGGPLPKAAGDLLARQGVNIWSLYGSTEVGIIATVFPEKQGLEWEYFTINKHCAAEFVPVGEGLYELTVIRKPTQVLMITNTTYNGMDAYATNDLLARHPTKSDHWKIIGRADDQIMLSTGEKTNPGPLEAILQQHPHVNAAVMFGRGRFQNGVIIEPKKDFAFDPKDIKRLAEFRNSLWPKIEEMNAFAPTHSRLFKEMVLVASPLKPFLWTAKGTTRRALILEAYKSEIDEIYNLAEESTQTDLEIPSEWSKENTLRFVRLAVKSVVKNQLNDEDDIFERGCDSLQATWIRNTILHALRSIPSVSIRTIPSQFVYENPTILSLAGFIATLVNDGNLIDSPSKIDTMLNMVEKYGSNFKEHVPLISGNDYSRDNGFVVLITGTTGGLGANVLAKLIAEKSVTRIFALNRKSNVPLLERQVSSLVDRGLDQDIITSSKLRLIEGDISPEGLDVEPFIEQEIRATVTHMIHIAWRVDFNLSLPSFEKNIGGVRALIDLALSSPRKYPPRLLFTSSVGVIRNTDGSEYIAENTLDDPVIAEGQGYSESKWVAERILDRAASCTSLRPITVRVGQICGGANGSWNASDWVPALIKSSVSLGCLPNITGIISWIPADIVAACLIEMLGAEESPLHLVHPKPVPLKRILDYVGAELELPLCPYNEWITKLRGIRENSLQSEAKLMRNIPALKILDFFRNTQMSDGSKEAMGLANLAVEKAARCSVTLRVINPIDTADVLKWLKYWKSIDFL